MGRFLLRRLVLLPVVLIMLNFLGYVYATQAIRIHQAQSPYGRREEAPPSITEAYLTYAQGLLRFDFGAMPFGANVGVGELGWHFSSVCWLACPWEGLPCSSIRRVRATG
jgi:ABC-type antimicrobial peptide transport system permease subunit